MALAKYVTRTITRTEITIKEGGKEVYKDMTDSPTDTVNMFKKMTGKTNVTFEVKEIVENRRMPTEFFLANSEVVAKGDDKDETKTGGNA